MRGKISRNMLAGVAGFVVLWAASSSFAQGNHPLTKITTPAEWEAFAKKLAPPYQRAGLVATVGPNGVTFSMSPSTFAGPNAVQAEVRLPNSYQIEVKYELLTFPDKIQNGYGVGVGLWVEGAAVDGQVRAVRTVEPRQGQRYMAGRTTPLPGGKTHYAIAMNPTQSWKGRLGLRRTGKEIIMLATDTPDGPLEEYQRYPVSDAPTRMISLYTTTGGSEVEMKARLYDLRILTGSDLPPVPAKRNQPTSTVVPFPPPQSTVVVTTERDDKKDDDPERTETTASPLFHWLFAMVTFLVGVPVGVVIGRKWKTAPDEADVRDRGRHAQ